MIAAIIVFVYSLALFVALTNLILMPRLKGASPVCFEVLIPARNEAENLQRLLPPLISSGVQVTVFDDESEDGTAEVARRLRAQVISPAGPLPPGWVGKNRACHELAAVASRDWVLFLDADTVPSPDFAAAFSNFLTTLPSDASVVTGMPRMIPGKGLEPLYLSWVPWILLATNPFGLVARTGVGHNRFTNGQFVAWRRNLLQNLKPHEKVKGEVLEDVKIGRLLASKGIRVHGANLTEHFAVQMYGTLGEAFDGMSKNSAEIAGSTIGSIFLSVLFLVYGFGWIMCGAFWWLALSLILLSKFVADRTVKMPWWIWPFFPLTCVGAAVTIVRSLLWKRRGQMHWKGRVYDTR